MSQKFEKLKTLLKELFQLDQPDLDFGLYRIMHSKSAEVSEFLDKDLLPQVKEAFGLYKTADKAELEKELANAIERAQSLGADPETLPKVKELRARLVNDAVDIGGLENEVYEHLFSFFRRYYLEGDFLAKRVYRPGVYAIPYEGEEVKFHWANRDQYYIKTSEYLRDYAFRLRPDDATAPMRVHFRLVDAAEGEHGNVKAAEGKDRVFVLASEDFIAEEDRDTRFFESAFKDRLLGTIDTLDSTIDGTLIHSDNFQALQLVRGRMREQVKCVYIDPPYNTASSSIPYKNNYRHSIMGFDDVRPHRFAASALARRWRYFREHRQGGKNGAWELPHLEYQELTADDPNFPKGSDENEEGYYRILLDRSQEEIVAKLSELKTLILNGNLKPWEFRGLKAISFSRHLYEPLLYLDQKIVEISPVPLNKGELNLVEDIKEFHDASPAFYAGKELYLLRNLSKGRGVGFFEAGNFHPDFILWVMVGERQYISFVDPKGIRNLGFNSEKIRFFETIKDIERRLAEPSVTLSSFIISNTPSHEMRRLWSVEKSAMDSRNILFQDEDKATYIRDMMHRIVGSNIGRA